MPGRHLSLVTATPWAGAHGTLLDSDRHFARHCHATYGIGVLQQGTQRSASGRGLVEATEGELITSNPGEVHDGHPHGSPSRRWRMVHLEPTLLREVAAPEDPLPEWARPVVRDAALRAALLALFARLDAWRRATAPAAVLACDEALAVVCTQMLTRHGTLAAPRPAAAAVECMRERLADDVSSPPTLGELAQLAGLSRYQALRRFQQVYGLPPHAWLMQQRLERARNLIGRGVPLAQAAGEAGFADQSHLSRVFVRQYGFTPSAWRNAMAPQ